MKMKKHKLIVLGAGRPHFGELPSALRQAGANTSVLQWQIRAAGVSLKDTIFVGGYQVEKVRELSPKLKIIENNYWSETGSAGSFLKAILQHNSPVFVCYSDILFREKICLDLTKVGADIVVAYDSLAKERIGEKDHHTSNNREMVGLNDENVIALGKNIHPSCIDGEFIGLVYFNQTALLRLSELSKIHRENLSKLELSELIEFLRLNRLTVAGVDVGGDWAEYIEGDEIGRFVLGTKAETLSRLNGIIQSGIILEQISFNYQEWQNKREKLVSRIKQHFKKQKLIIRSSATSEDGFNVSNAGGYDSVLNVDPEGDLVYSVDKVFSSYGNRQCSNDQVLIQPMLRDVAYSGVAFTETLEYAAPWFVINYDTGSDTTSITGGTSKDHKTLYIRRALKDLNDLQPQFRNLILALKEIEDLLRISALDVEFAIDDKNRVYILQVRPITKQNNIVSQLSADDYESYIEAAKEKLRSLEVAPLTIPGNSTQLYGNMPDWNPAEIIGTSPSQLALTTYQYLIMDDTWATQRAEYGYRDVRPTPLMSTFAGKPYVCARASFTSFIPAALDDELAGRLLKFYLNTLRNDPSLHDKIEFSVIPTCLTTGFKKWSKKLKVDGGFTHSEINQLKTALQGITSSAFNRIEADLEKVERLQKRHAELSNKSLSIVEKLHFLIHDCRQLGTLPFAHLARSGFIAVNLLRDAVEFGIISSAAFEAFMSSIKTVSHEFRVDAQKVANGSIELEMFLQKYGHLRPGTYDVLSARYIDDPEYYLNPIIDGLSNNHAVESTAAPEWDKEKHNFFQSLAEINLPSEPSIVENFLRTAIEGREYAKFAFSKNLSDALECVADIGHSLGMAREEIENIPLQDFLMLRMGSIDHKRVYEQFLKKAQHNHFLRQLSIRCELPSVIRSSRDLDFFVQGAEIPNYIGSKSIRAECVSLGDRENDLLDVSGKIVLIPQADPGYDWLFSKQIVGLITMYGGANSHMAIRSAEFRLPAAIGVGRQKYQNYKIAKILELSPAQSTIKILQ